MILSSDRLHTFEVFAEDYNLSHTAKRLHLSQPAVHAQLKALAVEIGAPLYRRVGRSLVPTPEGIELAAFARETNERTQDLLQRLRGETADRPLVLAAGAGALVHLLAPGLHAFAKAKAKTKQARVEVVTSDATQALDLVRQGQAHVGVGVLPATPTDLVLHTLARAKQVVVIPRSHRLATQRSVSLSDLDDEALILPPEGGAQRNLIDAALTAKNIRVHVSAITRGWDVVLKLVELGVGIGIVNDTCAIPRTLKARPLRELPIVTYSAFHRPKPRAEVSDLVRAFVDGARRPSP